MKKSILLLAVATVALASCSKDEITSINNGEGISFRSSIGRPQSRANLTTLATLGAFKVTAIGNSANYITNLNVTTKNNGAKWDPEATYYWPNYELAFFAHAPSDLTGVSVLNGAKKINNFTPPTTAAAQKDVLISYNKGTKAANEGAGIALNFKHALSQIEVRAKLLNPNIRIEVIGVKIGSVRSRSTFTFPELVTNNAFSLPRSNWSTEVEKDSYISRGTVGLNLTAAPQSIMFGTDNFMLIPQQLTGWDTPTDRTNTKKGAYLSVLCRIFSIDTTKAETLLFPDAADKYGFSSVPISTNWEPGKKYIYTLEYLGTDSGGGLVDPDPKDPSKPVDPSITTPGRPGDPIIGGPIKFSVSVENWVDASSDIKVP